MRALAAIALGAVLAVSVRADAAGLEWLRKAQERAGGAATLAALRGVKLRRQVRNPAVGMQVEQSVAYLVGGGLRQENALPFGRMVVYVGQDGGWTNGPQGSGPLAGPQLEQARGELFRVREALLLADRMPDREVKFLGEAAEGDRAAVRLEVAAKDGSARAELWLDRQTAELFKTSYQGVALAGAPPLVEEIYADFRMAGRVRVPHRTAIRQGGVAAAEVSLVEIEFAAELTEADLAQGAP